MSSGSIPTLPNELITYIGGFTAEKSFDDLDRIIESGICSFSRDDELRIVKSLINRVKAAGYNCFSTVEAKLEQESHPLLIVQELKRIFTKQSLASEQDLKNCIKLGFNPSKILLHYMSEFELCVPHYTDCDSNYRRGLTSASINLDAVQEFSERITWLHECGATYFRGTTTALKITSLFTTYYLQDLAQALDKMERPTSSPFYQDFLDQLELYGPKEVAEKFMTERLFIFDRSESDSARNTTEKSIKVLDHPNLVVDVIKALHKLSKVYVIPKDLNNIGALSDEQDNYLLLCLRYVQISSDFASNKDIFEPFIPIAKALSPKKLHVLDGEYPFKAELEEYLSSSSEEDIAPRSKRRRLDDQALLQRQ